MSNLPIPPRHVPGPVRLVEGDGTYAVHGFDRYAVLWWRTCFSLAGISAIDEVIHRRLQDDPEAQLVFITMVSREADVRPAPRSREALTKVLERYQPNLAATAIVFEGDGFKATVLRSIVTGVNLAARNRLPSKVFRTLPEACRWLETVQGDGGLPAATLKKTILDFRAEISGSPYSIR